MPRKKQTEEVVETIETVSEDIVNVEEVKPTKAAEETTAKAAAKKTTRKSTKKAAEAETAAAAEEPVTKAKKTTKKAAGEKDAQTGEPVKKTRSSKKKEETVSEQPKEKTTKKTTAKKTTKKVGAAAVSEVVSNKETTVEQTVKNLAEEIMEMPIEEEVSEVVSSPRRSIAFIGSECHPFVKTGGLGDVMYALPRALTKMNCDVRVILPRYQCIPEKYQQKMVYRGEFYMDFGYTGRNVYIGIMEYVEDGVVYDFIDNQEFFSGPKPYTNLVDDIPKYCLFSKAALAALNYMNWIPNIVHCHDWQAGLVPVYLKTIFAPTPVGSAKSILTIHNLRFQGIYGVDSIKYWTGLPDYVFTYEGLKTGNNDANMLKGGITYADRVTTVSNTYAGEIQTGEYGEGLETHLQYHSNRLRGIVNGIDIDMWNPATDTALKFNYDSSNALEQKAKNKTALQEELGLEVDESKYVVGLISRLTDQKGLDLVNTVIPAVMDGNTQIVVLGTGDKQYEDSFRYYGETYQGNFAACIEYDEEKAHRIYAGADSVLVPSRFEPCGLTQLNAMRYGTAPIVRETGGLKDTVEPYNVFTNSGNGFTFDRYEADLLYDAISRAKDLYFNDRPAWDEMVLRDLAKDVSWENSASKYKDLYLELTQW